MPIGLEVLEGEEMIEEAKGDKDNMSITVNVTRPAASRHARAATSSAARTYPAVAERVLDDMSREELQEELKRARAELKQSKKEVHGLRKELAEVKATPALSGAMDGTTEIPGTTE